MIVYEEFLADKCQTLAQVFRFLGVDPNTEVNVEQRVNPSGMPRSAKLNQWIYGANFAKRAVAQLVPKKSRRRARALIESWNTGPKMQPSDALRVELDRLYTPDVRFVEKHLGRSVEAWHERRLA